MPDPEFDLLDIECGSITAPAGCGKTWLIADALRRHAGRKPVLILTHTNAGVSALRKRLSDNAVPPRRYRLLTIDGWAMRLISTFPNRAGHDPAILTAPRPDYPRIHSAASGLLANKHIDDVVKASYARVLVDEYQDCSLAQHEIVSRAADMLPTVVLGDPMQAIFGFRGSRLARWQTEVCQRFPSVGRLRIPHRWIRAGAPELGLWFLEAYSRLYEGEQIDIRGAPGIDWVELDGGDQDHERRLGAAQCAPRTAADRILILGQSTNPLSQQDFARRTPGAITVEAVDLRDLVAFADDWEIGSANALAKLVRFAAQVMNVRATPFLARIASLVRGSAHTEPTHADQLALRFLDQLSYGAAADLLDGLCSQAGVRPHRPGVLHACRKALRTTVMPSAIGFREAVIRQRDQYRAVGRPLPRRGVGSTLLCKGLEAEVVVVLYADELDASNLYVAMTRASNKVIICSRTPVLPLQYSHSA